MSDARHSGGVQTFGCGRAKYQGLPQSAKSIHGNPELALLKQWISIHNADSDKPGISAPPPECRAVFRLPEKAARFTVSQSFETRHNRSSEPRYPLLFYTVHAFHKMFHDTSYYRHVPV